MAGGSEWRLGVESEWEADLVLLRLVRRAVVVDLDLKLRGHDVEHVSCPAVFPVLVARGRVVYVEECESGWALVIASRAVPRAL